MWIDVGLVNAQTSQNLVGLDFFYYQSTNNVDQVKEYHKYIKVMLKNIIQEYKINDKRNAQVDFLV